MKAPAAAVRATVMAGLIVVLLSSTAAAAPPVLLSVSHVRGHPSATWTLPPGVRPSVIELATDPITASDGYFFTENVTVFELLEPGQTQWLSRDRLRPGTYYVHVAGIDEPCHSDGRCPAREWSQVQTLVIPERKRPPRYQARVRSTHRNAIGDRTRNWTYLGDTLSVSLQNANAAATDRQRYRVCHTARGAARCRIRVLVGARPDTWRLRVLERWAGYRGERYVGYIDFSWLVAGKAVAHKRIWIWE